MQITVRQVRHESAAAGRRGCRQLFVDNVTRPASGTADRSPVLPGNTRRPESLDEQFRKFMHRHRRVIPQR